MRAIPIALADHLATGATTICHLFKFKCKDGTILGFTDLDADIKFTDGPDGEITYQRSNGMSMSAFDMSASPAVDNAEAIAAVSSPDVTEQKIRAGLFSHARFWVYVVNYLSLPDGYYIKASGATGETKFNDQTFQVELRAKKQMLKQPIHESYDKLCPVAYGSAACGRSFEWFEAEVATVDGDEPDRIFTITPGDDWPAGDVFTGGVLRVLSGNNAGAEVDVDVQNGDSFELMLPLPYPLDPEDELEFRIDCNKEARDDVGGCKSPLRWGADWIYHHRGFPDIPTAAAAALLSPGAQIMGEGGGTLPMGNDS